MASPFVVSAHGETVVLWDFGFLRCGPTLRRRVGSRHIGGRAADSARAPGVTGAALQDFGKEKLSHWVPGLHAFWAGEGDFSGGHAFFRPIQSGSEGRLSGVLSVAHIRKQPTVRLAWNIRRTWCSKHRSGHDPK